MKNLFFKEIKLAMHPIIWVFIFVFPFMILIPSYPTFIGFIYVIACYPILFLGAQKGIQSNDLLYTCLLPIRKSDAVKARMLTVLFLQLVCITIMCCISPLAYTIHESVKAAATNPEDAIDIGLGMKGFISTLGISIFSLSIYDLIFFPLFYKNGRSIVAGTLIGMFVFMILQTVLIIVLPLSIEPYKALLEDNLLVQFAVLAGGIIVYILLHILVYRVSSKRLEKVDL